MLGCCDPVRRLAEVNGEDGRAKAIAKHVIPLIVFTVPYTSPSQILKSKAQWLPLKI